MQQCISRTYATCRGSHDLSILFFAVLPNSILRSKQCNTVPGLELWVTMT